MGRAGAHLGAVLPKPMRSTNSVDPLPAAGIMIMLVLFPALTDFFPGLCVRPQNVRMIRGLPFEFERFGIFIFIFNMRQRISNQLKMVVYDWWNDGNKIGPSSSHPFLSLKILRRAGRLCQKSRPAKVNEHVVSAAKRVHHTRSALSRSLVLASLR